jgi:hypothetical protein
MQKWRGRANRGGAQNLAVSDHHNQVGFQFRKPGGQIRRAGFFRLDHRQAVVQRE